MAIELHGQDIPILTIHDLDDEEVPERKFESSREFLSAWKVDYDIRVAAEKAAKASSNTG